MPQPLLEQLAALTPAQLATLTETERLEIAESLDAHERCEALGSLRAFAESPHFCGLTLSPLMAAIMDAADGVPVTTIDDATCRTHFGCALDDLPETARRIVAVRAGGRAGKTSRLVAVAALYAAIKVPLLTLAHGERAVSLITAPDMTLARQVLGFVRGYCEASPALASRVTRDTVDELELLRPDGQHVTIRVRAASRGGRGGRGFVLVFAGLDEAAFFRDESSGVVNDTEIFRAIEQRLVPGAQCWIASTPWVEGVGVLEETLAKDLGAHVHALCCVAPTRALNSTWDPDGTIEASMRERDPDNADREILAIPLAAGSHQFFSHEAIDAMFDESLPQITPPHIGMVAAAGGDTGFVKNSSALAIVERIEAEGDPTRYQLDLLEERKPAPGLPLKAKEIAREFADLFTPYGTREFVTDSHEIVEVSDALLEKNCTTVTAPDPHEAFVAARVVIHEGRVRAPKNARLRAQLRSVVAKPMPGGGVRIVMPQAQDGSHGDLVSAFVRALWRAQAATEPDLDLGRAPRRNR